MKKLYPYPSGWSTLVGAKARLNIHGLWRHFGFPGEPKASCRSPFRKDTKPSFSVNADGTLWHDFATGDGGDVVDFFRHASGLSRSAACRKFIELASGHFRPAPRPPRLRQAGAKPKPVFPEFRKGTAPDFQQLADLRNISVEGVELVSKRGLLWFATLKDCPAWIVTDSARVNAQGRRMDGLPWEHIEGQPKSYTLPGSWASWPIGITDVQPFPTIALCEGGPDLLAASHFIACESREARCAPVAMLGASQRIHSAALPMFANKCVRIFSHDDGDGRAAVERWARQLEAVGADVDAFSFAGLWQATGQPVKDLNDCALIQADDFEAERILWSLMP